MPSGIYTPTLTEIGANTTVLSLLGDAQYLGFLPIVIVAFKVQIDFIAAVNTIVRVSVPIPSNFALNTDATGVIETGRDALAAGEIGLIRATGTSNTLTFEIFPQYLAGPREWSAVASYRVLP